MLCSQGGWQAFARAVFILYSLFSLEYLVVALFQIPWLSEYAGVTGSNQKGLEYRRASIVCRHLQCILSKQTVQKVNFMT